jgi:hypothetical protein
VTDIQGIISGAGGVTVGGASAQVTFDAHGTFNYTGPTLVNAGTLRVDGTLTSSPLTVANGAALEGAGTVGSVQFGPGSSFAFNSRGPGQYDELHVTDAIDLSPGPTLIVNGASNLAEGQTFSILHSEGGITSTFAGLTDGSIFTSDHKRFLIHYTASDVTLTLLPQFAPPAYYPASVGSGPHGLAMGDFNGDGTPDLVAVSGDSLTVLLGNGDGTFQSQPPITIPGSQLKAVTVGDFNHDGILDLAAAGGPSFSGTVYVLLGNGDGTFQDPVAYPVGALPTDIEAPDLNGDGTPDLVVLNQNDSGMNGSISILYGNGDGTFQPSAAPPLTFPGSTTVAFATLLDPDSGRVDLVVGNTAGFAGFNSEISVEVNQGNDANGQAVFQEADYHTMSNINPTALAVADFNGDGKPDVLWASGGRVGVFLWGAFGTPLFSDTGASGWAVAVGDFDGDGNLDVALPGGPGDSRLVVVYGHGDGTFGAPSAYTVNPGNNPPLGVLAGDLNGDGAPDLAVLTQYLGGAAPAPVAILLNGGYSGGHAPHGAGRSPRRPSARTHLAALALPDLAGSPGLPAAPRAGLSVAPTAGPAAPQPAPPAAAAAPLDQVFALLAPDDFRPAVAPRRPRAVPAPDHRLAWDMGQEGWWAEAPPIEGPAG